MGAKKLKPVRADERPFVLDEHDLKRWGYKIIDLIVEETKNPYRRPVYPSSENVAKANEFFGGELPQHPENVDDLLEKIKSEVLPLTENCHHPRHLGYIGAAPLALSSMMEALTKFLRMRPTVWRSHPASSQIEKTLIQWLSQMTGFANQEVGGYVTNGGSWANLVGLAVARAKKTNWDVRKEGLYGGPRMRIYAATNTHFCFERAVELMGMGTDSLRKISVDADHRMNLQELEAAIERDLKAGDLPICVVGNAGAVDTGTIDPLDELSKIARKNKMWFHIDGSYGAFASTVPSCRPLFKGIENADSLSLDPHKWMNMPLEAGCILVRQWSDLESVFEKSPAYLQGLKTPGDHNSWQYTFELTRSDRALKIWLALKQFGVPTFVTMISNHLEMARKLGVLIQSSTDFELMSAPSLGVCCFRYVGDHTGDLNALNREIEKALVKDGRALVSSSVIRGQFVLRACISNHLVTWPDIEDVISIIRDLGQKLRAIKPN